MPRVNPQELAAKLRGERFKPGGPDVARASDPIADTAMVVTLDELRPYELNPRVVRNPRYDDIKASIRERGLDSPPPITRRPNDAHYIIRNGGNTRLSILNELWQETGDERFFRIACLFRPWTARGEILALTGHLAENELRGELTFIERALGVEKLRELYTREAGAALTQKELSDRLKQDGYPIGQSLISRMQDATRHLLPSIPKILYGGLGKHQIERLIALRRAAQRVFERHATRESGAGNFDALFHALSASFDLDPAAFNVQRLQDELIGRMASLLGADYDALTLELVNVEAWQQSLLREPTAPDTPAALEATTSELDPAVTEPSLRTAERNEPQALPTLAAPRVDNAPRPPGAVQSASQPSSAGADEKVTVPRSSKTHVAAIPPKVERLPAVDRQLSKAGAEHEQQNPTFTLQEASSTACQHPPLSELWDIDPSLSEPDLLRDEIGRLAREIAHEADAASSIESIDAGIGFVCHCPSERSAAPPRAGAARVRALEHLLAALSAAYVPGGSAIHDSPLVGELAPLLQGTFAGKRESSPLMRLSDGALLKLFRLIRLARRLVDIQSTALSCADLPHSPR